MNQDVLIYIMSFLEYSDTINLCLVNKYTNYIFINNLNKYFSLLSRKDKEKIFLEYFGIFSSYYLEELLNNLQPSNYDITNYCLLKNIKNMSNRVLDNINILYSHIKTPFDYDEYSYIYHVIEEYYRCYTNKIPTYQIQCIIYGGYISGSYDIAYLTMIKKILEKIVDKNGIICLLPYFCIFIDDISYNKVISVSSDISYSLLKHSFRIACENKNTRLIEFFIEKVTILDIENLFSTICDDINIINIFLKYIGPSDDDNRGLRKIVAMGNTSIFKSLLEDNRVDISKYTNSVLDTACYHENFEMIKLISEHKSMKYNWTVVTIIKNIKTRIQTNKTRKMINMLLENDEMKNYIKK